MNEIVLCSNAKLLPTLPPVPVLDQLAKAEAQLHRSIRSRRKFQGVKYED